MSNPKLKTVCYRDSYGDELVVSPFRGGAAGLELMATHDSGCCVFDDPKVIRDLANQLLAVADAVERAKGAEE